MRGSAKPRHCQMLSFSFSDFHSSCIQSHPQAAVRYAKNDGANRLSMALTIRDFALHKDKLRGPCRRSGGARHRGAHPVAYGCWRSEERQPSAHASRFGLSACVRARREREKGRSRRGRSGSGGPQQKDCPFVLLAIEKRGVLTPKPQEGKRRREGYVAGCLAVLAACSKRDRGCMPSSLHPDTPTCTCTGALSSSGRPAG